MISLEPSLELMKLPMLELLSSKSVLTKERRWSTTTGFKPLGVLLNEVILN